jgi:hypothetical protein
MNKDVLPVVRDERTIAVENASYRWSNVIFVVGLLADIEYRIWFLHNHSCWDLFMLLIIGGNIPTIIQLRERVLMRDMARLLVFTAVIAAVLAAGVAVVFSQHVHR